MTNAGIAGLMNLVAFVLVGAAAWSASHDVMTSIGVVAAIWVITPDRAV